MPNNDSHITYDAKGNAVSFVGPDAVNLFRAATLASGLRLMKAGIRPTRGFTWKRGFEMAKQYTGKDYKSKKDADQCIADLHQWVQTMKAALPHEQQAR